MKKLQQGFLLCFLFAVTGDSRSLESLSDQKTYYSSPAPHTGSTPAAPKPSSPHKKPSCGTPPASSGGHSSPAIIPPPAVVPPVVPTPSTPSISSPPLITDQKVPPFVPGTCIYWSTHPDAIVAIFGYWGSIGNLFGAACAATFGKNPSLQDALKNTRTDGIGALYREGTAALLNAMSCKTYTFTAPDVKHAFAFAVGGGDKAAAAQAKIFRRQSRRGSRFIWVVNLEYVAWDMQGFV